MEAVYAGSSLRQFDWLSSSRAKGIIPPSIDI